QSGEVKGTPPYVRCGRATWRATPGRRSRVSLALARAFERGGYRLDDRSQLARCERDERHAGAVRVARAARAIAITVEGRSVGALGAVVFAVDPLLHDTVVCRSCG